jgi:hypothetical protein
MPTMRPAASSTVNGSMEPRSRRPSRRAISHSIVSGDGTVVDQTSTLRRRAPRRRVRVGMRGLERLQAGVRAASVTGEVWRHLGASAVVALQ